MSAKWPPSGRELSAESSKPLDLLGFACPSSGREVAANCPRGFLSSGSASRYSAILDRTHLRDRPAALAQLEIDTASPLVSLPSKISRNSRAVQARSPGW